MTSGTLTHIALFLWRSNAPTTALDEWQRRLEELPSRIAELRSVSVGHDVVHGERSWDTAVVSVFDDLGGLARYNDDEEHAAIKRISAPLISQFAQVDVVDAGISPDDE